MVTSKRKKPSGSRFNILGWIKAHRRSIGWKLFWSYLIAILIGSILLSIEEISIEKGQDALSYEDAFFITTSAFTDTGLSPVNISEKLTLFGEIVVMICIQIGGIGLMAAKYFLWTIVLRRISSAASKELLYIEKGGVEVNASEKMIRSSLVVFIGVLTFSTIVFSLYFHLKPQTEWGNDIGDNLDPTRDYGQSLWYGLFHSTSSMNNAGFDIFGGRSLEIFSHDMFVQIFTLVLFILGGIGFPILYDVSRWIKKRVAHDRRARLTLLSKITLSGYFLILVIGFAMSLIGEAVFASASNEAVQGTSGMTALFNNTAFTTAEKGMVVFFHTASARSAGFSYYPMEAFAPSSTVTIGILMFIGAGPSSTGGGVRVSAFIVVVLALLRFRKSGAQLNMFKKTLHPDTRRSAFRTLIASAVFVILIALLITFSFKINSPPNNDAVASFSRFQNQMFFETVSAFGTTGLSYKGATSGMSTFSKVMICFMMIIGQLGVNNVLTMFKKSGKSIAVVKKYPVERVFGI